LDKDLQASNAGEAMRIMNTTGAAQPTHDTPNDRELERLREFTQQLPDRRDFGLFFFYGILYTSLTFSIQTAFFTFNSFSNIYEMCFRINSTI